MKINAIVWTCFVLLMTSCADESKIELVNRLDSVGVVSKNTVPSSPKKLFALFALHGKVPRSYEPVKKRFSDWQDDVCVSEIHELSHFDEEVEFKLLDDLEMEYRNRATRYVPTTPYKILSRNTYTFATYKEASLQRRELLGH